MYKNFYKRINKSINIDKAKAKVLLFNQLLNEEDLIDVFKHRRLDTKLIESYHNHLKGKFTRAENKEIAETLEERLHQGSMLKMKINELKLEL